MEEKALKILAIDSSAVSAGCAVTDGGSVVAESFVNVGLTHSQTLLPMISDTLKNARMSISDMDYLAVSSGPGSFTGVRIGVATVKGLAFTHNIPCVGVSTLSTIACSMQGFSGYICAVMDARRDQVYTALFCGGDSVTRMTEDEAISVDELCIRLSKLEGRIWLCGDGADMCFAKLRDKLRDVAVAPAKVKYQNGVGAAIAAVCAIEQGKAVPAQELVPVYLRLSQAERELNNKRGNG